jgi:RimJ/RimL family protein N-acetyltransferase
VHRLELFMSGVSSAAADWRDGLPVLRGDRVTLRELRTTDAPRLLHLLTTPDVTRFLATPPATIAGFEQFIDWTHGQRLAGRHLCFGIVPDGADGAVGILQLWPLVADLSVAEMGFVLAAPFWGTGVFVHAANAVLRFAFETLGVHRIEARSAASNGRGNGVLRKLGAVEECRLRSGFVCGDQYHDHVLWSILRGDWRNARSRPRHGRMDSKAPTS